MVTCYGIMPGPSESNSVAPQGGYRPDDLRCRDGDAVGDAGAAGVHQRGQVVAVRRRAPAPPVSVPAKAAGLQQAAAPARRHTELASGGAGPRHQPGWAEYGYCASYSRLFWGLRLHLVATLRGLPIGFALAGAKADERQVLLGLLHDDPTLAASRPGQILLADKNYFGREFEASAASSCCAVLARANPNDPAAGSSNRSARASSRSSTHLRDNSIWNNTVDTPQVGSSCASFNACWP